MSDTKKHDSGNAQRSNIAVGPSAAVGGIGIGMVCGAAPSWDFIRAAQQVAMSPEAQIALDNIQMQNTGSLVYGLILAVGGLSLAIAGFTQNQRTEIAEAAERLKNQPKAADKNVATLTVEPATDPTFQL